MIFLGIDNGVTGAVGVINSEPWEIAMPGKASVKVYKTPVRKTLVGRRKVSVYETSGMFGILESAVAHEDRAFCVLEHAQPMSRWVLDPTTKKKVKRTEGVVSVARYIEGFGIWQGMLVAMQIPFEIVHPKVWQKTMLLNDTSRQHKKSDSVARANRLFPDLRLTPSRHNEADAVCMAEYARRICEGGSLSAKKILSQQGG